MSFWNRFDEDFEMEDGTSLNLSFYYTPSGDVEVDLNEMTITVIPEVPAQYIDICFTFDDVGAKEDEHESAYHRAMEIL